MKHWIRVFFFILLVRFCRRRERLLSSLGSFSGDSRTPAPAVDYHYWIHARLGLTPEQERSLEPIEEKFTGHRKELMALIREGNRELAEAIISDRSDSQRVKAAVEKIHRAQGDLQNAVLEHVFAMRPVLSAKQYDRLVQMTADALRDAPELQ